MRLLEGIIILKCPCIPFFGNQGLHNKIVLGGNKGCSGVICEGSPYKHILKGVDFGLQNFSCYSNGVGDDCNVVDVVYFHCRNEASTNGHEFRFNRCDVYRVDL